MFTQQVCMCLSATSLFYKILLAAGRCYIGNAHTFTLSIFCEAAYDISSCKHCLNKTQFRVTETLLGTYISGIETTDSWQFYKYNKYMYWGICRPCINIAAAATPQNVKLPTLVCSSYTQKKKHLYGDEPVTINKITCKGGRVIIK